MRILIIEDEPGLNQALRRGLEQEQYAVDGALDGEEGLRLALDGAYALIVLDVLLPRLSGLEVCRRIRQYHCQTPILLLTARDSVDDRVKGLDSGADDYLVKPFAFRELLARIRALLRRPASDRAAVLQVGDLTMDTITHEVRRGEDQIHLSGKEYAVLEYFMRHPGQVLTRQMIIEHAWDFSFDGFSNVIDVYIRYLRRKIDEDREPKLIHTIRGTGYQMRA